MDEYTWTLLVILGEWSIAGLVAAFIFGTIIRWTRGNKHEK